MQNYENLIADPKVSTGNGFNPYEDDEDLTDDLGCDDDHDDIDNETWKYLSNDLEE